jgi:hypothetical protein
MAGYHHSTVHSDLLSDRPFKSFSSITIIFESGISAGIDRYSFRSGLCGVNLSPFMKSWELWGNVRGEWRLHDEHSGTEVLSDGCTHEFVIISHDRFLVEAVRLCQTDRNHPGSSQMQLSGFVLSGDVVFPHGTLSLDHRLTDRE